MAKTDKNKTETVNNPGNRGGYTTSQDVSEADKKVGDTVPTSGTGKRGVTGVEVGTPVYVGEEAPTGDMPEVVGGKVAPRGTVEATTKYQVGDGLRYLLKMDNEKKAMYLSLLSQIPGIYGKGEAYSKQELKSVASGGYIPVRDVDAKALENVMRYADTLGITYEEAIDQLSANKNLAVSFFNVEPGKGRKTIPAESLVAEIGDKFQNTFDTAVPKKVARQYAAEVQAAYAKNPALSAQERENILLKYLEGAASGLTQKEGYQPRGVLGEYITQLRQEYYDNGLPIDENKIYRMAVSSLRDPQELENNKQRVRQRAELVFPPLKEYIARGESVRDVLSPYMRLKANIFEQNEADINPSDMYDVMEGDKLKNINDYKMSLYRSPEYKKTNAYFERQLSDTRGLLNYLGID